MHATVRNLAFIILCGCLFGCIALFVGQDACWDLLQYHYYNGYAVLHGVLFKHIAPAMLMSFYNPFFDVINYGLITLHAPKLTTFMLGAFSGLIAYFVWKIAELMFDNLPIQTRRCAIFFSLLIGLTGSLHLSLLNTTTNDTKFTVLILMAVYFFLLSLKYTAAHRYLLLSGFIYGLAVGFKMVAVYFFPGFLAAWLYSEYQSSACAKRLLVYVVSIGLGFLIANGVWMYLLYVHFKNPLFPFYNNIFHSPFLPFDSFNPTFKNVSWFHKAFFPIFFSLKNAIVTDSLTRDVRPLSLVVACILAACWPAKEKKPLVNATFIFFFVSYIFWIGLFFIYRYFLPLEALTGALLVYLVFSRLKFFTGALLLSALCVLFAVTTVYPDWENRGAFQNDYFTVQPPSLPYASKIVIATSRMAYLIPYFKSNQHQFIGLVFLWYGAKDISLAGLKDNHFLFYEMNEIYNDLKQQKPVYLLAFQEVHPEYLASLKLFSLFGVEMMASSCLYFKSNLDNYKLCPLRLKEDEASKANIIALKQEAAAMAAVVKS